MALDLPRLRVAARMYAIRQAAGGNQEYAIRQAAEGNQDARAYILRRFIGHAKQGRAVGPETARVVADVLERVLAGENIGKLLGTQAKRGRPRNYKNAILVHAMVRSLMVVPEWPGRTQRRGENAPATAAEAIGMPLDTVLGNYKRVSKLIKTIKDNPFLDLERSGFTPEEELYLRDPEKYLFCRTSSSNFYCVRISRFFLLNVNKAVTFKFPLARRLR